ncbi:DUF4019 domain-containing protein, partial [Enterobacter asburiae]
MKFNWLYKKVGLLEEMGAEPQSVRQPLGRPSSRTFQSVMQTKTLPGTPAGDYQIIQFQTRFANKPNAVETVVLSREQAYWASLQKTESMVTPVFATPI